MEPSRAAAARRRPSGRNIGRYCTATDGRTAWDVDPVSGTRRLEGAAQASNERLRALRTCQVDWRRFYKQVSYAGIANNDGRKQHRIRLESKDGTPDTWLIDTETGLLSGAELTIVNGLGEKNRMWLRLSDWTGFGGWLFPKTWTLQRRHHRVIETVEKVELVAEPAIAVFRIPEDEQVDAVPANRPADRVQIKLVTIAPTHVASIRVRIKASEMGKTLATLFSEVMTHLNMVGAPTVGAPFTRYHSFGAEIDIEAGIPIEKPVKDGGRVKSGKLPGGKVVSTWHIGPYHRLTQTYNKVQSWMKANKLEANGGSWEFYWTDPGLEPDSAKWRTQVLWPVK